MRLKLFLYVLAAVLVGSTISSVRADDVVDLEDGHQCCRAPHPEALVVPADQFVGDNAVAYAAAKKIPDICCKLFCYCGCDQVDGHTSLLECFISDHSVGCPTCKGEVLLALQLKKQNKTLGQIQEAVDKKYGSTYLFKNQSKALKEYRAKRQYKS